MFTAAELGMLTAQKQAKDTEPKRKAKSDAAEYKKMTKDIPEEFHDIRNDMYAWLKETGKSKQEEFGDIEMDLEDRRTIFIRMKGSIDNPKIEYDFKGLKTKIKEDIIKEKQTWKELKEQFKQDIGLGKQDTLDKKDKATQTKFELEKPKNNKLKPTLELKKKSEDDDDF